MPRWKPQSVIERFWQYVDKRGTDECWEWTASLMQKGYGQFNIGDHRTVRANRFSFELHYGPLGKDHALHTCDNRKCVNPKHLFRGSQPVNMADMTKKGRRHSILDESKVKSIKLYLLNRWPHRKIAEHFCVSKCTIQAIGTGRLWRNVPWPQFQIPS
jgi:hypothetical protein